MNNKHNIKEAADLMKISERTLRTLIANKEIEHHRIGSRIIISEKNIENFFDAHIVFCKSDLT